MNPPWVYSRHALLTIGSGAVVVAALFLTTRAWGALPTWLAWAALFTTSGLTLVGAVYIRITARRAVLEARQKEALEHEVTDRKRAEEALWLLASIVGRGLDLPTVLNAIAETAATLFEAEVGFRLVDGDALVRAAATPGARAIMQRERIRIGESISGRVAVSGEPIVTLDVPNDPRLVAEHRGSSAEDRTSALMCVPVRVAGRIAGTISIYRSRTDGFDADTLGRAMSLADHAGIAIANARLYGEADRRRREAEQLAQVARTLTETLDTAAVGRRIVDTVLTFFSAQGSGLRVLQPDGTLRGVAWSGTPLSYMDRRDDVIPSGAGVSGQAVLRRAPAWSTDIVRDMTVDLTEEQRRRIDAAGMQSMLAVPLTVKSNVIGALLIADSAGRTFSDGDVALMQAFADQAALALENARLYEAARESIRQLAATSDQLRAAKGLAEEADRAKSEFLASMSHELRTPLNSIIGFSKVLLNQTYGELTPRQRTYVESVHKSSSFLLELINTILEFSRIEAGRVDFHVEPIDVTALVAECVEAATPLVLEKLLALELDASPDVGAIVADRVKVKQIVVNLLGNAIKFTEAGRIVVRVRSEGALVQLSVADTGIGIPPSEISLLFEPFHRVSSRFGSTAGGTGLGLAICKKFVELHKGRIWVESQPREGSTFHVTLPRNAV